jgi:ABC-type hemin transport system substrate-binding protein
VRARPRELAGDRRDAADPRLRPGQIGAELEARRTALQRRSRRFAGLRALSYTNLGAGGWASGARTTADVLLGLAGLCNAAAAAGLQGDVPADAERLIALAPDVFVVGQPDASESSPPSARFLLEEPALAGLEALRAGRILTLPPALFTSASPELLRGAEALIGELERALPGTAPVPSGQ